MNKTRVHTLITLIQSITGNPNQSNQVIKRNKDIQITEEEVKFLFVNDMILCVESLKDSNKNYLELIKEFSKVAGYKINTQKSVVFLYTKNEISLKEINYSIHNTIKNSKILRNNFKQGGESTVKMTRIW